VVDDDGASARFVYCAHLRAVTRALDERCGGGEMTKRHVIQILYTERCRFLPLALSRVRHALALRDDRLDVEVRLVLVETVVDAVARRFRSSPTVRIDERDVVPSVDAIRRALDESSRRRASEEPLTRCAPGG
jgi:hypothetical protein